jgi:hypothetical protein
MEVSREQLQLMRRQADQALEQAERMNELLGRVVRLTEPLERAQRGGEYMAGELKKAIFGAEEAAIEAEVVGGGAAGEAEAPPVSPGEAVEIADEAEEAAEDARPPER